MLLARNRIVSAAACRHSFAPFAVTSRRGYWWGHETLEDRSAAKRKELENRVVRWSNPESDMEIKREVFYCPMRYEAEKNAMESPLNKFSFNSTDYYQFVRYPRLSIVTDPKFYHWQKQMNRHRQLVKSQLFIKERLLALGPDLSAAIFLCHRNCRVRFKGHTDWTQADWRNKMPSYFPEDYQPGWYIEEIDASNSLLVFEGLGSLRNLIYLKILDLSYSPLIDEWCLDRITGEFQESLEVLNISGCEKVTWSGLECISRLRRLKKLILHDMDNVQDIKLICLMLLDALPDLEIQGVDYVDLKLLEGTEHECLAKEIDNFLLEEGQPSAEAAGNNVAEKSAETEAAPSRSSIQSQ